MEGINNGNDSINIHADIQCRKDKIFSCTDVSKRRTKIVCTLG